VLILSTPGDAFFGTISRTSFYACSFDWCCDILAGREEEWSTQARLESECLVSSGIWTSDMPADNGAYLFEPRAAVRLPYSLRTLTFLGGQIWEEVAYQCIIFV
jgi:hypothetical protein